MIQGTRPENLVAELMVRNHKFLSGVSPKLGGKDEGPDPHELLEAALAACTIITLQMYANRKGYKLDSTEVIVKVLTEGAESKISRQISYRGELDQEQKTRLTQIADACPIHKLLESHIQIQTEVTE
mgnify:CR=1 FL=1